MNSLKRVSAKIVQQMYALMDLLSRQQSRQEEQKGQPGSTEVAGPRGLTYPSKFRLSNAGYVDLWRNIQQRSHMCRKTWCCSEKRSLSQGHTSLEIGWPWCAGNLTLCTWRDLQLWCTYLSARDSWRLRKIKRCGRQSERASGLINSCQAICQVHGKSDAPEHIFVSTGVRNTTCCAPRWDGGPCLRVKIYFPPKLRQN